VTHWPLTLLVGSITLHAGCDRVWKLDEVEPGRDAGTGLDGADADAVDTPPDARACFGSSLGLFRTCLSAPLDPPLGLGGVLDTTNDTSCRSVVQSTGKEVCVIAAERIVIANALVVRGERPLVLISGDTIEVTALVDASSTAGRSAAGAISLGMCGSAGNGTDATNGGGGGAGGTFAFRGGNPMGGGGVAGTAHAAEPVTALLDLRGGCQGANGGLSTSGGTRGRGGFGGGAVYLIAGTSIRIDTSGAINASGGGGIGGPIKGGGGGGGAGGIIGLDAPTVLVDGTLFARGGGGASGGSDTAVGLKGSEPTNATTQTPGGSVALSGTGSGNGWPGCGAPNGTVGGDAVPGGAAVAAGGGGGGGACGYIFAYGESVMINAVTNPAVQP
jgi:hypothetical protein